MRTFEGAAAVARVRSPPARATPTGSPAAHVYPVRPVAAAGARPAAGTASTALPAAGQRTAGAAVSVGVLSTGAGVAACGCPGTRAIRAGCAGRLGGTASAGVWRARVAATATARVRVRAAGAWRMSFSFASTGRSWSTPARR
jgi:hypothetical protein